MELRSSEEFSLVFGRSEFPGHSGGRLQRWLLGGEEVIAVRRVTLRIAVPLVRASLRMIVLG